ncbi:MAG TPA: HAD family hydrolase [Thermoanaerobaculia bacterium]|jgi:putative hydrolase of the HAD superfamily
MLKAVAFDLWETLITDTPEQSRRQERLRLQRMTDILDGRATPDRIEHAYRALWHRCHELYWSADVDVPCRRQIEHFAEAMEMELDAATVEALEEVYARAAVDELPSIVDGAPEVLEELKERGYRVGLISNTGRTPGSALRDVLAELRLARHIDAMVFSNEHGACKPQPSIFAALRDGLGVDYAETMFVGDNLYVDVHGAQRCGMRAVHFIPSVRGTAVAPHVEHGLEIVPDATIRDLRELLDVEVLLPARGEKVRRSRG